MRWWLTTSCIAVTILSLLTLVYAERPSGVATESSGHRSDADKDSSSDHSADKSRGRDNGESEKRLKEKMEREDENSTSRQYGKSIRASTAASSVVDLSGPVLIGRAMIPKERQPDELHHSMGMFIGMLRFVWRQYLSPKYAAMAATRE